MSPSNVFNGYYYLAFLQSVFSRRTGTPLQLAQAPEARGDRQFLKDKTRLKAGGKIQALNRISEMPASEREKIHANSLIISEKNELLAKKAALRLDIKRTNHEIVLNNRREPCLQVARSS